jgi:hypothetical protein
VPPNHFPFDRWPVADCTAGELLLEQQPKSPIPRADKGYDTNAIRHKAEGKATMPNIPPKANRRWKDRFAPFLYRDRNAIAHVRTAQGRPPRMIDQRRTSLRPSASPPLHLLVTSHGWNSRRTTSREQHFFPSLGGAK